MRLEVEHYDSAIDGTDVTAITITLYIYKTDKVEIPKLPKRLWDGEPGIASALWYLHEMAANLERKQSRNARKAQDEGKNNRDGHGDADHDGLFGGPPRVDQ